MLNLLFSFLFIAFVAVFLIMIERLWEFIWEISVGLLVAGTKFLFAPGWMRIAGYNYWQTLVVCAAGGIMSVFFFYFIGGWFVERLGRVFNPNKMARKKFTRMNRFIVRVKKRFGVIGIAFVTPPLLSIPLGSLVAARYYRKKKGTVRLLIYSVLLWDLILSTLVHVFGYHIE